MYRATKRYCLHASVGKTSKLWLLRSSWKLDSISRRYACVHGLLILMLDPPPPLEQSVSDDACNFKRSWFTDSFIGVWCPYFVHIRKSNVKFRKKGVNHFVKIDQLCPFSCFLQRLGLAFSRALFNFEIGITRTLGTKLPRYNYKRQDASLMTKHMALSSFVLGEVLMWRYLFGRCLIEIQCADTSTN